MKTIKGKLLALLLIMVSVLFLASCKDKTYTLSFVSEHGNAPSAITVKKDEEINLRDSKYQLTAEGYVFKGWFFDAQKTNMALVFNLEEDTTVYAKWAKVNTVTFNSNGGSTVEPIKVESGSTIEAPSQPTKQGFKFAGWYKEATFTNKFNFENTEINNDITLYAKWNAVYTVTYNTNGGNEIEPTSVEVGKTYTLPEDPVKEGFRFAGWYTDEALQNAYVSTGEIGSNLTLFAKWTGNQYTVIYNANGGKGNMAQDAFVYGTSKQLAKNIFTKVGYKFVGWSLTATGEKDFNDEQIVLNLAKSGSVTVYALWEKVEYHVVFVPNYAEQKNTPEEIDDVVLKVGEQFDLARTLADLDHYTFNKWTLDVDNVDAAYAIGSTFILSEEIISAYANQNNQVKLYGLWNPKKYSVEFVGGEGATGSMASQEFTFGVAQALTHNAFEKEGFSFVGWTDQDNNEYTDGQQISVSKNLTLTAKWHDLVYTIRFNANGGTGTMSNQNTPVDEDTFTANVKLNANAFTKVGYDFDGWALSANGEKVYDDKADVELTANVELFALWKKANYTVSFHGNGGTSAAGMQSIVGQLGDSTNLPANSYELDHYNFMGWSIVQGGSVVFANQAEITLTEEAIASFTNKMLVLYAVWSPKSYNVVFKANGAEGTMEPQQFTYGVSQALSKNTFTYNGYTFKGWSLTANGTVLYLDQAEVSMEADVELFAVWEMVTKKVVVLTTNGYQAGSVANKLGEFTIQDTTNTCEDAGYVGQNINELMAAANYTYNGLTLIGFYRNFQANEALTTESTYTTTDETIYVYAYFALTLSIDMSAVNQENIFINVYKEKPIADSYNLYEYLPELKADSDKIAFYDKADLRNVTESLQVKAYSIPKWGADLTIQIDNSLDTYAITLEDSSVVYVTYLYQGTYITTHNNVNVIFNEDKENLFDATDPKAFDVKAKKSGYSIAEIVGESGAVRLFQMFTFKMTSSLSAPNYAEYNGKDLTSTGSRWLNTTKEAYHVGSANIFKLRVNSSDTNGTPITNINDVDIKYTIKLSDSASDLTKVFVDNFTINNKKYSRAIGFKDGSDKIYLYVLNVVDTDNTYIAIQFTEEAIGKGFSIKVASKQGVTHEDDNFTIQVLVNSGVNVESHEELKAYYADLNVTEINIHKTITAQLSADQFRPYEDKMLVKNYEPTNQLYYAQHGQPTGDVYVRAVTNDSIINNHLIVNGNYFVIDGSGLPIIDDVNPEDGSPLFPEDHEAVNKDNPWGTDSEGNNIWIKNSQTSIFANLLAYAETAYSQDAVNHPHQYERVDGNGYIVGTGAYNLTYRQFGNSVTYNNLYIIGNTITPQVNYSQAAELVKSEEELAGYNSGGYNGIMVRGCTTNTNNVVIDYANTGVNVSCDKATANCKDTYIFYSWGYSLYGWSSCTVNLENCDFRYSGGACVHIDEHRTEKGHVEVYDYKEGYKKGQDNQTTLTIDFDPTINIDRKTQLINWVVGNEVWFRLMDLSATTALLTAGMTDILHGYTNSQYSLVKSYNDLSAGDIAYSQGTDGNPDMWNFAIMLREAGEAFDAATTDGSFGVFDMNIVGQTIKREPSLDDTSSWVSYVGNSLRDELIPSSGLKGFMQPTKAKNPGLFVFPVSSMSGYVDSLKPINDSTLEAQVALIMGIYDAFSGMSAQRSAIINMMASQAAGTAVEVPAEQQVFNAWSAYALGLSRNGILDHAGNSRGYGYLEVGLDVFGIRGTIYSYYYEG